MDWIKIYEKFIEKYRNQELKNNTFYYKHHIIPKHIGGDNSNQNLIRLTLRQHTLAHYILYKGYHRQEDKIAWLMMSGQTEEGLLERRKLAVLRSNQSDKVKILKEKFKDKKWVEQRKIKSKNTKLLNNNNRYYSEEGRKKLSESMKNREITDDFRQKISKARINEFNNLSEKELLDRFSHLKKENHPMYGKERKGNQAANFGKFKDIYILIDRDKNEKIFYGIKDFIKYGFTESVIRKYSNKGIINKDFTRVPKFWGFEIKKINNPEYGKDWGERKNKQFSFTKENYKKVLENRKVDKPYPPKYEYILIKDNFIIKKTNTIKEFLNDLISEKCYRKVENKGIINEKNLPQNKNLWGCEIKKIKLQ